MGRIIPTFLKKEGKSMNIWHDISPKRIKPDDFYAVIEITKGSKSKYEMDKETGLLKLDRVLYTSTPSTTQPITAISPSPSCLPTSSRRCGTFSRSISSLRAISLPRSARPGAPKRPGR